MSSFDECICSENCGFARRPPAIGGPARLHSQLKAMKVILLATEFAIEEPNNSARLKSLFSVYFIAK